MKIEFFCIIGLLLLASAALAGGGGQEMDSLAKRYLISTQPSEEGNPWYFRMTRSAYDMEMPFHQLDNENQLIDSAGGENFSAVFSGHAGWLFSGPQPGTEAWSGFLNRVFAGAADPFDGGLTGQYSPGMVPAEAEVEHQITDPVTGNVFSGWLLPDDLYLEIKSADGEILFASRSEPFSALDLLDYNNRISVEPACAKGIFAEEKGRIIGFDTEDKLEETIGDDAYSFYWFNRVALAPFVNTYIDVAGNEYARYINASFFLNLILTYVDPTPLSDQQRLPFMPGPGFAAAVQAAKVKRGANDFPMLFTQPLPQLGTRHGTNICGLPPLLTMLQERNCEGMDGAGKDSYCRPYSTIALLTEVYRRTFNEDLEMPREPGSGFTFALLQRALDSGGLCFSEQYPFLLELAGFKGASFEQFSETARSALDKLDERKICLREDGLPKACADEMERFRTDDKRHSPRSDWITITAIPQQSLVLTERDPDKLWLAQQEELYLLTLYLLAHGERVALAALSYIDVPGAAEKQVAMHAGLAWDFDAETMTLVDFVESNKELRAKMPLPLTMVKKQIVGISFFRDALKRSE